MPETSWNKKPNFFIVGAPKCGTTAMHWYLKEHPEIYIPDRKELHYFGRDLAFKNDRSLSKYQTAFDTWTDEKVGGEASVWYLYSQTAASEIYEFNPAAKIIAMLRNPADMVYSLHNQAMLVGRERIVDFEKALNAETGRREGTIPCHDTFPNELLYYSDVAKYSEQLARYFEFFGRENVRVVVFDDFKQDVETEYKKTLDFLGVDFTDGIDLQPRNQNRKFKNQRLHFLLNNPAPWLRKIAKSVLPSKLMHSAKGRLNKLNIERAPREKLSKHLRDRLNSMYRDEIEALSDLLDRPFHFWLEPE